MSTVTDEALLATMKERLATAHSAKFGAFGLLKVADPDAYQALEWAAMEVLRQRDDESWSVAHDDEHDEGEMSIAAASYAFLAGEQVKSERRSKPDRVSTTAPSLSVPPSWPWDAKWWKPKNVHRNLIRAIALLAVEWGRWSRARVNDYAQSTVSTDAEG